MQLSLFPLQGIGIPRPHLKTETAKSLKLRKNNPPAPILGLSSADDDRTPIRHTARHQRERREKRRAVIFHSHDPSVKMTDTRSGYRATTA